MLQQINEIDNMWLRVVLFVDEECNVIIDKTRSECFLSLLSTQRLAA